MADEPETAEPQMDGVPPGTELAAEEAARAARHIERRRALHYLVAVVALSVLVRLPLMQFPMGTSAGTVGYVGQHWLEGGVPYRDAWDYRPPGLYLLSGVVVRQLAPLGAAAGQGLLRLFLGSRDNAVRITSAEAMPKTCRLAMMFFDLLAVLLVYRLVRLWCGHTEALVAAGVCGFFGGAFLVQGDCLGAGPPMNCLLVAAMIAALRSHGRRPLWLALAGLACGLAACFEQLALLYAVALVVWAAAVRRGADGALRRWLLRPALVLVAALVPLACFGLYFWAQGAFTEFWRSAVVYNVLYRWFPMAMRSPSYHALVLRSLTPEQGALWLFAAGWAIHAFSVGFRPQTRLVAYWGVAAVLAALAARHVEAAHFLQTVPPLAIAAALAITNPSERFTVRDERGRIQTGSAVLLLLAAALAFGFFYTEYKAFKTHSARTEVNDERVAASVADTIRDRTTHGHPIYVWGAGPQIYVLADRPAAHRIFYTRALNVPWIVEEFFGGLEVFEDISRTLQRVEPVFFITTDAALPGDPAREGPLQDWFRYMRGHYVEPLRKMKETWPFLLYVRKDRALDR